MGLKITYAAVFFLAMNLFAGVWISTGVAGDIGVDTRVGGGDEVDSAIDNASEVQSGAPTGSTLFGMYNVLADTLSTLALPVTAGPTMLHRAGVPEVITHDILQNLILFVYATGIIELLLRYEVL